MEGEVRILTRPISAILASAMILFVGLVGFIAGALVGAALFERNEALLPLENLYMFTSIFWLTVGPLLILAGYKLYFLEKWAAWLASVIILFDLIMGLPITTYLGGSIDASDFFALTLDVVTLIAIASAWKAYK